jgi:plasmid stabilization system protein ParE
MSTTFHVRWTPEAEEDAAGILDWFDDQIDANKVLNQFEKRARSLETLPSRGRIVPELKRIGIATYREVFWKPWRMLYKIDEETVWIVAILDARRDLTDLLHERLVR